MEKILWMKKLTAIFAAVVEYILIYIAKFIVIRKELEELGDTELVAGTGMWMEG